MSEDKSSNIVSTKTIFGVAAVWFGAHAGGGFATGNQTMNFFVQKGWYSLILPILSMALIALVYRESMIFAKNNKTFEYRSWSKKLYAPYDKVLAVFFEVGYLIIVLLGTGASIAGSAELLSQNGISYAIGVIITGVFFFILTIFGASLIRNASSFMTIVIAVCLTIICFIGIRAKVSNLAALASAKYHVTTFSEALWYSLKYAGFQSFVLAIVISVSEPLKTNKSINKTAWIGFALNTVLIMISCTMLFSWMPESGKDPLPTLYVCKQLGSPVLTILYSFVLFFAFVSTGIGCVFGAVARFENILKVPENIVFRRGLISLITMIFSMGISTFGLTKIVVVGYGYMGAAGVFLVILPVLTIGHYKNKKFQKNKNFNSTIKESV